MSARNAAAAETKEAHAHGDWSDSKLAELQIESQSEKQQPKSQKAKASAECGEWLHMYRALAAAVQTDWAEAQRLFYEITSDDPGFHASILLMSAILRDNRGDALAMSSLLG